MKRSRLRLVGASPNAQALRPLLREFAQRGGLVSATSDQRLRTLHDLTSEFDTLEVLAFGEVVGRLAALAGDDPVPLPQRGVILAAIAEACAELPRESPFSASRQFHGIHRRMEQALGQLAGYGVGSDALRASAERLDPVTAARITSFADVADRVEDTLHALGLERNALRLQRCIGRTDPPDAPLGRLLVHAGSEYEPLDADFLAWAARSGCEVTVVVDHLRDGGQRFEGAEAMAKHLQAPLEVRDEGGTLAHALFTGHSAPAGLNVEIATAPDPLSEVEWALRRCQKGMAEGRSADEFALFARDLELYAPLVDAAAWRMGVPIRRVRRVPLLSVAFARLVLDALEFCASNDVRGLSRVASRTYFGGTADMQATLRQVSLEAFSTGAQQWDVLAHWADANQAEVPWLSLLLEWREEAQREPKSLGAWLGMVRDLGVLPWEWDDASPTSQRDEYAQNALQRTLAQVANVSRVRSPGRYSFRQFVDLSRSLWERAEVSLPAVGHGVTLGSTAEQLGAVSCVWVFGLLEGTFPRRRSEDPVLTDEQRRELSSVLGLPHPLPDSHSEARREREEFVRVCAAPTRELVLSYPEVDEDRDNVPAFYLEEVRAVASEVREVRYRRADLAPAPDEATNDADRRLAEALADPGEAPPPSWEISPAARSIVSGEPGRAYGVRELRDALWCPFRYWARHRAGLNPADEETRWFSLSKLAMEARLAMQPTRQDAIDALNAALQRSLEKLYATTEEAELALLRAGGERVIKELVHREFACRSLWPRDSQRVDVPLDQDPTFRSTITVDGKLIKLSGLAPAVSQSGHTTIVSLYRAGTVLESKQIGSKDPWLSIRGSQEFELSLWFYATQRPAMVEVDAMSGQRVVLATKGDARSVSDIPPHIELLTIAGASTEHGGKRFRQNLVHAVGSIERGDLAPRPDETCQTCSFGELCRSHQDFGETDDPFGEVGDGL